MLGLHFCARAFFSCGERGPLTVAASLVAEHRLQTRRLSSCGPRAQLLHGMWDFPRPGLEPVSPALAGRLSTTAPPGKPNLFLIFIYLAVLGLSCGTQDLRCHVQDFYLRHEGSFSCSMWDLLVVACGI